MNVNSETPRASTGSASDGVTSPDSQSLVQNELSTSPEPVHEYFDFATSLELMPGVPGFTDNAWMNYAETMAEVDQIFSDKLPIAATIDINKASEIDECRILSGPAGPTKTFMDLVWPQCSAKDLESGLESTTASAVRLEGTSHTALGASEKEIELMMEFMDEVCFMQHNGLKALSAAHKSWLLILLMRSPTFYYTSLSITAYYSSRKISVNSELGSIAFQHYHEYRAKALENFHKLSISRSLVFGEVLICGIQLAHLEVCLCLKFDSSFAFLC